MANHKKHIPTVQEPYNSNPFTSSFAALGRFFNTNINWAIVLLVLAVFSTIARVLQNLVGVFTDSNTPHNSGALPTSTPHSPDVAVIVAVFVFVFVILLVALVVGTIINTFVQGALSYVALESEKGRTVGFNEALQAVAARFWRLFAAQLLATLKIIGWTCLFIVPGIIAALRYSMLNYLIMDEPAHAKGVSESHQRAKALSKGRLVEVFGVATVAGIIPIVGSLLGLTGKAALYRQFQVYTDKNLEKPKVHWLNYLGFMLLGVLLLLILLICMVVVAIILSRQ